MKMEYTLSMTFLTELGIKTSLSISGVNSTITETQAKSHHKFNLNACSFF